MRNKGFALPLFAWVLIGFTLTAGFGALQTHRLKSLKAEYASYKSEVIRLGKEQEAKTKAAIAAQKGATENVKRDYRSAVTELKRLRESRSGYVPPAPQSSQGADDPAPEHELNCPAATDDALKLWYLQEWLRKQGFDTD